MDYINNNTINNYYYNYIIIIIIINNNNNNNNNNNYNNIIIIIIKIYILLFGCAELNGASPWLLIPAGTIFMFGRYLHSIGIGATMNNRYYFLLTLLTLLILLLLLRVNGMKITLYSIISFSALNGYLFRKMLF